MGKEEIILSNKKLGVETVFSSEILTAGMTEGNVVYINDNYENLDKINKHEILHLFEESDLFIAIKKRLLNEISKEKLEILRKGYYPLYSSLYSSENNIRDLIDTEIVIDYIIDKNLNDVYEKIVNSGSKISSNKRYLNITLSKKIEEQFPKLSKWEKLFVLNHYKGGLPSGINKYEIIRNNINDELLRLYKYADNHDNFVIDYKDNKYLDKRFESEIKGLKLNGECETLENFTNNRDEIMKEMAGNFSVILHAEYKHIVDFIKNTDYEDSFKCLMLNETLTKIYRQEKVKDDSETIISKREMNKSINSHMTLNEVVLDTIYNNLDDYNNFANLYYAGVELFNNKIISNSEVNIMDLNTFGKGKWIKFNCKSSDLENYIKNSQDLAALLKDTPWCTKYLASTHLAQGDFYVFVDNDNKPHIAVKMNGCEIDEVRGLKNGNDQELEDDYRDVAIEFLTKNKDVKYGRKWLEKEEWNKRLIRWINKIDNNNLLDDEIEFLETDLFAKADYKRHANENSNLVELKKRIKGSQQIRNFIAKKYGCLSSEVYIGDISRKDVKKIFFPYVVVVGNVDFFNAKNVVNMSKLRIVYGKASFFNSSIRSLSNLEIIGEGDFGHFRGRTLKKLRMIEKNVNFSGSNDIDLSSLEYIGNNAIFIQSGIKSLCSLIYIGGGAAFFESSISDISKLKCINDGVNFNDCNIFTAPSLESLGEFTANGLFEEYLSDRFVKIDGKYVRKNTSTRK